MVLNSDSQGLPNVFSWELNIPKLLVVEEVGGVNFHGFIFFWAREDRPGYFYLFWENRDWNSKDNLKIFEKVRKFWAVRSKH